MINKCKMTILFIYDISLAASIKHLFLVKKLFQQIYITLFYVIEDRLKNKVKEYFSGIRY